MSVTKPSLRQILDTLDLEDVEPSAKLILLILAARADDAGTCYPSLAHIARKTGLSRPTIIHHLGELEKAKLISVERRTRETRAGRKAKDSNMYTLTHLGKNFNKGVVKEFAHPSKEFGAGGGQETLHKRGTGFNGLLNGPIDDPAKKSTRDTTLSEDLADTKWANDGRAHGQK